MDKVTETQFQRYAVRAYNHIPVTREIKATTCRSQSRAAKSGAATP